MNKSEWDPIFKDYAALVIHNLQSAETSAAFSEYAQFLVDRTQRLPAWQIALPVINCLAAGGSLEDGIIVASAWVPLYLASEVMDDVEDKDFLPDRFLTSPEVASNLAAGLMFASFHTLASIQDAEKARQVVRIFSACGFDATNGQHRDLVQARQSVELFLDDYWEIILQKSGSVFRAVAEGGAAAAGAGETIVEALGEYGAALGVMLQLMDDCRDAFSDAQEEIRWEISLPLLLYLLAVGEENIVFPEVSSRAEWSSLLKKAGVIQAIASLLLQWKAQALGSLAPLHNSREKDILERLPSLLLEKISFIPDEVIDEKDS